MPYSRLDSKTNQRLSTWFSTASVSFMNPSPIASLIDHTLLRPDATEAEIIQLCSEAREYGFYSVCIPGAQLATARKELAGSRVKLCSVVGFPTGAHLQLVKAYEAEQLVNVGAQEIDMVMNLGWFKDKREIEVVEDIEGVVKAAGSARVKVIIETALLSEDEKVRASECVVKAGAHFVKTSTGFSTAGATVTDIELIKKTVGEFFGIKASGGVKTLSQLESLIQAGATRIGSSNSVAIMKEWLSLKHSEPS